MSTKPTTDRSSRLAPMARRYGPFVAVAALIGGAVVAFGGGGDGDDDAADQVAVEGGSDQADLIRSGPMTPEKADLLGEEVNFGPDCDTETGRIKLPSVYAPPCVTPFEGDNGGATAPGVTEDEVKVVYYVADPQLDPLGTAAVEGAGGSLAVDPIVDTIEGYAAVYADLFEAYGRTVTIEPYIGTGAAEDKAAARADAIAIAEREPFAVLGSPAQAGEVFAEELAARGIICAPGCATGFAQSIVEDNFPLVWPNALTSSQSARLSAEAIGKLAGPGKAVMAGDTETQAEDRVYGIAHYDTPDGDQQELYGQLVDALADYDIEPAVDAEFTLDVARLQETARTVIGKLKDAGVTTVIYAGDPLTPDVLTAEATAQDYHPEWILGPNYLADTELFARTYDQDQWVNGFGVALASTAGSTKTADAYRLYTWAHDAEPPVNTYAGIDPPIRTLFTAIHLAGPELTVESFRDGLYRFPASGGGPTRTHISWGEHGVWPDLDLGMNDDVSIIRWDPDARGEDFAGNEGLGMYRYLDGGQRYALGEIPEDPEEAGLFDMSSSVVEYEELPPEDQVPDYPPPDLG